MIYSFYVGSFAVYNILHNLQMYVLLVYNSILMKQVFKKYLKCISVSYLFLFVSANYTEQWL